MVNKRFVIRNTINIFCVFLVGKVSSQLVDSGCEISTAKRAETTEVVEHPFVRDNSCNIVRRSIRNVLEIFAGKLVGFVIPDRKDGKSIFSIGKVLAVRAVYVCQSAAQNGNNSSTLNSKNNYSGKFSKSLETKRRSYEVDLQTYLPWVVDDMDEGDEYEQILNSYFIAQDRDCVSVNIDDIVVTDIQLDNGTLMETFL